jgi:outer membrane murein-binding lipoprotein Lpp
MAILDEIRTAVQGLKASIDALAARLGDNPTPAEVTAIADELRAASATLDTLDPDVPGGPLNPETPPIE